MFELTFGDGRQYDQDDLQDGSGDGSGAAGGPSLTLRGQAAAHTARATGVAATRRRAVTVGEDGVASLVDLQRLESGGGGGGFGGAVGGREGGERGGVVWTGSAKGALPLTGVTFQGESEEVKLFFGGGGLGGFLFLAMVSTRSSVVLILLAA